MITLDTGALVALERRNVHMSSVVAAAAQVGAPITVPTMVLVQWACFQPHRAMLRLLEAAIVEPLDANLARMASKAMASVEGANGSDAVVVASAARRAVTIFATNPDALTHLARFFGRVRVQPIRPNPPPPVLDGSIREWFARS